MKLKQITNAKECHVFDVTHCDSQQQFIIKKRNIFLTNFFGRFKFTFTTRKAIKSF